MGTELQRSGVPVELPLWSAQALIENPEIVRQIHRDYLSAGAEILTTNTFRTHRRSLAKGGLGDRAHELTELAVRLARDAISESGEDARIAGSISPLEDCYHPELSPGKSADEFLEIAEWLMESGADFLLLETMNNIAEMRSAIRACRKLDARFWVSVCPSARNPSRILSDEPIAECLAIAEGEGAEAFLANCASMAVIESAVERIASQAKIPFGGYANNGTPDDLAGWRFDREVHPDEFASHARRLVDMGASIVGGCCGTAPEHIAALSSVILSEAPTA